MGNPLFSLNFIEIIDLLTMSTYKRLKKKIREENKYK